MNTDKKVNTYQRKNICLISSDEKGSILILFAVTITLFFIGLAMAADIGWIMVTKGQLKNAADASALAGAASLIDEDILYGGSDQSDDFVQARDAAEQYAAYNKAGQVPLAIDRNPGNSASGGVVTGYIENPFNMANPLQTQNVPTHNSVQVTAERSASYNGLLGLFLGGMTGVNEVGVAAQSTATLENRISGFSLPDNGETLDMLPFAVYRDYWYAATNGNEPLPEWVACPDEPDQDDYWVYPGGVHVCADGIPEVKMYPYKEDICNQPWLSGNFGTVDIGPSNNSTSDLVRQINDGISYADLQEINGLILTDDDGDGIPSKWLQGDTGVSTSVASAIDNIIGEPRLLPLFKTANGQGNNSYYEIVEFVAVHVVAMKMNGKLSERHITVQPTQVMSQHAVVDPVAPPSKFVYAISLTR